MRPRGSVGDVSRSVLSVLDSGPATLRDVVQRGQGLSYRAAKYTLSRAVQRGEVAKVGRERDAGERRWRTVYEAVPPEQRNAALAQAPEDCGVLVLVGALGAWR